MVLHPAKPRRRSCRRQYGLRLEPYEKLPGVKTGLPAFIPINPEKEEQMPIRHTVRRGDSLWNLAHRYLGSGARWPLIYDFHNKEAAKPGQPALLLPIKNPDLIYVSQMIMIPARPKISPPGTGAKTEANQIAVPLNLKVTYAIGRDTPPIEYVGATADYTITTEMSGKISVELISPDRYRQSLELYLSKEPWKIKQKLREAYDPALCALTTKPEMSFECGSGKVSLKAADLGPYTVEVHLDSFNHLSGTLKPATLSGTVKAGGRDYKFSAELEFKVGVDFHPTPRGKVGEPGKAFNLQSEKTPAVKPTVSTTDWQDITTTVVWTLIGIGLAMLGCKLMTTTEGSTAIRPFLYTIDPNDPRNRRYFDET
jgi:hypothetical protein